VIPGVLLALASGLLFGSVGVVLRRVSRAGGSLFTYYVLFGAFYLVLSLVFQVRWSNLAGAARLPDLVLVIGFSGMVSGAGMLLMTRSMALGHGGISSAISQSALVVLLVLFASLDRLGPRGLAAAAFPVSIGTTILSFSLYSALVLRERFRALDVAALAAGSAGIVLLALAP
jgi:drug/metabolite transporter (DMT)-like permease